jgi:hypothetical protein
MQTKDIPAKYAVHEEPVSYNSQDPKMQSAIMYESEAWFVTVREIT